MTQTTLVDQAEKSGAHQLLVSSVLERQGVIKKASAEPAVSNAQAFADTVHNMWPLDTPEQVVLSAASIELQKQAMAAPRYARVNRAVNKAASVFNCLADVANARTAVDRERGVQKKAGTQLVFNEAVAFSLGNAYEILDATNTLLHNRELIPFSWRKQAAEAILDAAAQHGVALSFEDRSKLDASAGRGFGMPIDAARQLFVRATKVAGRNRGLAARVAVEAARLARSTEQDIAVLRPMMEKAAHVMDQIDDVYGVRVYYSSDPDIQLPEDVCFKTTATKVAHVANVFVTLAGQHYSRNEVARCKAAAFAAIDPTWPQKIASGISGFVDPDKLAEVSKEASADVLGRVMRGFGVRNVGDAPRQQASMRYEDEVNSWLRVANSWDADAVRTMDGAIEWKPQGISEMSLGRDNGIRGVAAPATKAASASTPATPEGVLGKMHQLGATLWHDLAALGDAPAVKVALEQLRRDGMVLTHSDPGHPTLYGLTVKGASWKAAEPQPEATGLLAPAATSALV